MRRSINLTKGFLLNNFSVQLLRTNKPFIPVLHNSTQTVFRRYSEIAKEAMDVDKYDVQNLINNPKEKYLLLDVRTKPEAESKELPFIPTAVNFPYLAIGFGYKPDQFKDAFGFDIPEKDDLIVVYCRSGVRSEMAAGILRSKGWTNVKNYKGSALDWHKQE
ncbi:thiosulfate sulfurtransferase, mitochondrial [Acrasis kona]|uniref:Thiosulfate sulfurtransferase, mitochondrial n=1 Tax=Acrasis kona TaxID=1008807 RepID=A0AAW2ZD04_9EUKA